MKAPKLKKLFKLRTPKTLLIKKFQLSLFITEENSMKYNEHSGLLEIW